MKSGPDRGDRFMRMDGMAAPRPPFIVTPQHGSSCWSPGFSRSGLAAQDRLKPGLQALRTTSIAGAGPGAHAPGFRPSGAM